MGCDPWVAEAYIEKDGRPDFSLARGFVDEDRPAGIESLSRKGQPDGFFDAREEAQVSVEQDAREFGRTISQGGWRLGLLVARNVSKGVGTGGNPSVTRVTDDGRVSAKEFAKGEVDGLKRGSKNEPGSHFDANQPVTREAYDLATERSARRSRLTWRGCMRMRRRRGKGSATTFVQTRTDVVRRTEPINKPLTP